MTHDKIKSLASLSNYLKHCYKKIFNEELTLTQPTDEYVKRIINYYESIIFCMPCNVYWLDINGNAVGCNKNVLDMFDFKTQDEFIGLSFNDMKIAGKWSDEAEEKFKNDTFEVLKTGIPKFNIEEPPIPHSDGRLIYFLTTRVPLFDHANKVIGVVGISTDITDRKEMESELIFAKEKAEAALFAKKTAEDKLREKSLDLQAILRDITERRYYLTGKFKGIYLTKREAECIICLARGMKAKEIAHILKIKPRTVEMFLENVKNKLHCNSNYQLIQAAIECQFLEGIRPVINNEIK